VILSDSFDALYADGREAAVDPLWVMMKQVVTPRPSPRAVPHLWEYAKLRPMLDRAAALVSAEDAERRVLMLTNPGLKPPCATDTLFAGLQYILPGEIAPAHRHTSFALRMIVEGDGAYTAVNGEKVLMHRGDLILTPSWMWHDHGNQTDEPMVWLDGLPLPVLQAVPVNFAQPYGESRYPALPAAADSNLIYPWPEMRARLDAACAPYVRIGYVQRIDSAPISKIIGAAAERLSPGSEVKLARETASTVYHVVEGSGCSVVDGKELVWRRGDTFAVPAWVDVAHRADAGEAAYLFRFDDRPMLDALGLYRQDTTSGA
jgi:gentisate 1,2-dioxygenase